MKIGACISVDRLETAAGIGFDYAELAVTAVNSLSEVQLKALQSSPIPIETFNCLFPGDLPLIKSEDALIRSYLNPAFEKLASIGGKLVVFGSGGARRIPEGCPYREALKRMVHIVRLIGDAAKEYRLKVAIEPLRFEETNFIHTLAEGAALAAAADHPNVGLLLDTFHFRSNREPVSQIGLIRDIDHVHIASLRRTAPVVEELPVYREVFDQLKASGYEGRISIECGYQDFEAEAAEGLKVLRQL